VKRNGKTAIESLTAISPSQWATDINTGARQIWNFILELEKTTSTLINNLIQLALEEKDHATVAFLQVFQYPSFIVELSVLNLFFPSN
jgi:hypothetical protein